MQSVELTRGKCAICTYPIEKDWAGPNPSLGSTCRNCSSRRDERFGPENVDIQVEKHLTFDPILGIYEYQFDWAGTKIMVNGKVGVITMPQADGDFVRFESGDDGPLGTFVKGVGYWDLLRIYKKIGGETEPPPLNLKPYAPKKIKLRKKPILPVHVEMDRGNIRSIQVGGGGFMGTPTEFGYLSSLHAFTNMYVRYKFGLAPNFVAEGGFCGKNFEVRNAGMFTGGVGLSVRMNPLADQFRSVMTAEKFKTLCTIDHLRNLLAEREQDRADVVIKDVDTLTILSTWVTVMETLLRFDWRKLKLRTVEDVWNHYCKLQDVLLNIMPLEELQGALEYAKKGRIIHCGVNY